MINVTSGHLLPRGASEAATAEVAVILTIG